MNTLIYMHQNLSRTLGVFGRRCALNSCCSSGTLIMRSAIALLFCAAVNSGCASNASDPYAGSGGAFLGTPTEPDIQSGRAIFAPNKCSSFTVGITTKRQVVEKLGAPAGWSTDVSGNSQFEYDYVETTGTFGMRRVIYAYFTFDRHQMLGAIKCPEVDQSNGIKFGAPVNSPAAEQPRVSRPNDRTRQPFDMQDGKIRFTNLAGSHYFVSGADPKTFQHIGGIYGKDESHVFYAYDIVDGSNPATFQYIGGDAGRDSNVVYIKGKKCSDCDAASFRLLDEGWYADKGAVYEGAQRLPGIDPQTFRRINFWFVKDSEHVYMSGAPIQGADATSFRLASCGICETCGEDKNRCYWFDHPVPCDCGTHSGAEFPNAMLNVPQGKVVISGRPGSIKDGLPSASFYSAGRRIVDPGKYELTLGCWSTTERKEVSTKLAVELEPGLYLLEQIDSNRCDYKISRPSLVLGRKDGPEIQLRKSEDEKVKWELELAPGRQSFMAICREVQRAGVREATTEVTMDLVPGGIYQLDADFASLENSCSIRSTRK